MSEPGIPLCCGKQTTSGWCPDHSPFVQQWSEHAIPVPDLAADSAKLERTKPCYCLGWETIRRVAEEGQLDTERVAFVAADDLFHYDFTAREQRLVQVVVERAKNILKCQCDPQCKQIHPVHTYETLDQLSSPENVAALIAEAKGL